MNSTTVLIRCDRYGKKECWVANNHWELQTALTMMFQRIDADGHYETTAAIGPFYDIFTEARQGNFRQIRAILRMRNGLPGETWEILRATDAGYYRVKTVKGQRKKGKHEQHTTRID